MPFVDQPLAATVTRVPACIAIGMAGLFVAMVKPHEVTTRIGVHLFHRLTTHTPTAYSFHQAHETGWMLP
jgi:hypothetical protein